jgi:uncharacterized membrane protein YqjE
MADNNPGGSRGLFESLSVLVTTLLGVAHTRLELLSTDLEEDRAHLLSLVCWYVAAMFFLAVGLVLVAILLVVAFWETHRLIALGALAGFFLLIGLVAWWFARHQAKTKPKLFFASLAELLKDWQSLDSR